MIRLAAFDLDGTLMGEDQQIHPAVRAALAAAQARGVVVTLATGRMFTATRPFARALGITAPLLCCQGGWIQAPGDPAPRYRRTLPAALAAEVLLRADAQGLHAILYADGQLFISQLRHSDSFYASLLGDHFTVGESWAEILRMHQADKVLLVAEPESIPAIGDSLRQWVDGQADVVRSHASFIEVVPSAVSKGSGLAWLSAHLGISREAVLAVGDHENDLSMIRWAGTGVAMGNAVETVLAAADWVAPSVADDGAAAALERFVMAEVPA